MGMFDAKMFGVSPLDMSGLKTSPMTPTIAAATSPRRRRGLPNMLGGLGDMLGGAVRGTVQAWTPSDGTRDPTVWDYVWGGQEHVDDVRNARLQRLGLMSAQSRMDREDADNKEAAQTRAAWAAYLASLPPEEQQRALLMGPEAYLAQQQPGTWHGGSGFTNAYRINRDGTTTIGGALPVQPRTGASPHAQADPDAQLNALGGSWD